MFQCFWLRSTQIWVWHHLTNKKMGSNCLINRYSWDFMAIYWNGFTYIKTWNHFYFLPVCGVPMKRSFWQKRPSEDGWRWFCCTYGWTMNKPSNLGCLNFPNGESSSWIQLLRESMGNMFGFLGSKSNQHLEDQWKLGPWPILALGNHFYKIEMG